MRYYEYSNDIGENGGRHSGGRPITLFDIDEDDEAIEMADKVILKVMGNENFPRGIILSHLQFDLDASPNYFVLLSD